jgi:hypothetical protein
MKQKPLLCRLSMHMWRVTKLQDERAPVWEHDAECIRCGDERSWPAHRSIDEWNKRPEHHKNDWLTKIITGGGSKAGG